MNNLGNLGVLINKNTRLVSLLLISGIILLIISGCGTFSVKQEADIAEDLVSGDHIFDGIKNFQIEDLEIIRRKTDKSANSDLVFIEVTASFDDVMNLTGKYQIEYSLYDSGWFIDNIVIEDENFMPSRGANFEDEDIYNQVLNVLSTVGYSNISDLVCLDVSTDLVNRLTTFDFGYTNTLDYLTEDVQASLIFDFDKYVGWYTDYRTFQLLDKYQDWSIDGTYAIEDGFTLVTIQLGPVGGGQITIHDARPTDHINIDFLNHLNSGHIANVETSKLYDLGEDSFSDILRDAMVNWNKPWHYVDAIEKYNYSIEIGGEFTSLNEFSYVTITNRPDYLLFIGEDKLATCYDDHVHFDTGARRILVEVHELEFIGK